MKKIIFILMLLTSCFVFTAESGDTVLKLINDVEKSPTADSSLEKYKRIIKYAEETKEEFVMYMPELTVFENDKINENTSLMLVGSYTAGVLKPQLTEKRALIAIKDGVKQQLSTYKLLKKSKNINVEIFEAMISLEQEGKIESVYNYYTVFETKGYQNNTGLLEDVSVIVTKLKVPMYITVNNEKVLVAAVSVGTSRELSSTLNFGVVSNVDPKDQEKAAKEILKNLLSNEEIKKIFKREVYSGACVQFMTSKNGMTKDQIYKTLRDDFNSNKNFDIRKEFQIKPFTFSKDQISSFGN